MAGQLIATAVGEHHGQLVVEARISASIHVPKGICLTLDVQWEFECCGLGVV